MPLGEVSTWPAAGGHERPLRGSETREASAEHRAALEKPDGRLWVERVSSLPLVPVVQLRSWPGRPSPPRERPLAECSSRSVEEVPPTVLGRFESPSFYRSGHCIEGRAGAGRISEKIRISNARSTTERGPKGLAKRTVLPNNRNGSSKTISHLYLYRAAAKCGFSTIAEPCLSLCLPKPHKSLTRKGAYF